MIKRDGKNAGLRKILVPTDFSPFSEEGVDYAATMAKQFGAELILIHVIESFPYIVTDTLTVMNYTDSYKTMAQTLLDELSLKLSKEGLPVKTRLAMGSPHGEI